MKKNVAVIIMGILIIIIPSKSFATYPVSDAGALMQMIKEYVLKNFDSVVNKANMLANFDKSYKSTIADPIANALKNTLVDQMANQTMNWVKSGFQGNPTFVVNPDVYFKNIANAGIKLSIDDLNKNGNVFSNSVIGNVVKKTRNDQTPISVQTQPTLPSTIQNNVCGDDNLSKLTINDLWGIDMTKEEIMKNPEKRISYEARKKELYKSFCEKDARTDIATQKKLTTAYNGNFSTGGWDGWLATTQDPRNTAYGNSVIVEQKINQRVENAKTNAKDELNQSGGSIPIKECVGGMIDQATGNTICDEQITKTPGNIVAEATKKSPFRNIETLLNANGFGDVVGTFATQSLNKLMNDTLASNLGNTGINSNTLNGLVDNYTNGSNYSNTPVTTSNSLTTISQADKNELIKPMLVQLNRELQEIFNLKSLNNSYYLSEITTYENNVNALGSCYDNLARHYSPYLDGIMNSNITSGKGYIGITLQSILTNKNRFLADIANLNTAESLTNSTINTLNSSNDTTVINNTYTTYQNAMADGIIPLPGISVPRELEYKQIRDTNNEDITNNLNPKTAQCSQMKSQVYNLCAEAYNANRNGDSGWYSQTKTLAETCPAI